MKRNELSALLQEQLRSEERETEVYARKVRETDHSVVKAIYTKLMRDSMSHADVLNFALAYLAKNQLEFVSVKETRNELLHLMNLEEEALRLFTAAATNVADQHLKSLLTMLALDEEHHYFLLRYVMENFVQRNEEIPV